MQLAKLISTKFCHWLNFLLSENFVIYTVHIWKSHIYLFTINTMQLGGWGYNSYNYCSALSLTKQKKNMHTVLSNTCIFCYSNFIIQCHAYRYIITVNTTNNIKELEVS